MRCSSSQSTRSRRGFTIPEVTAAIVLLGVAMLLVVEVALWVGKESIRSTDQQAAQECASNVLEKVRARSWDKLTPEWAKAERLPEEYQKLGWRLEVKVVSDDKQPLTKTVTVTVHSTRTGQKTTPPIEMMALFSSRSTEDEGDTP